MGEHAGGKRQLVFGLFALGDVDEFGGANAAPLVRDIATVDTELITRTVAAQAFGIVILVEAGADIADDPLVPLGGAQTQAVHADQLGDRITGHFGEALIALQNDAVLVNHDAARRRVVQRPEAFLAVAQGDLAAPQGLQQTVEAADQQTDLIVAGDR